MTSEATQWEPVLRSFPKQRELNPPVSGDPQAFERLLAKWTLISIDSENAFTDINRHLNQDIDSSFSGKAAEKFRSFARDLNKDLEDLPRVANELSSIFQHHRESLEALKNESKFALNRAMALKASHREAAKSEDDQRRRVEILSERLQEISRSGSANGQSTIATVRHDLESAHRTLDVRQKAVDEAMNDLSRFITNDVVQLSKSEDGLDQVTASKINRIDLGGLKDPSFLRSLVSTGIRIGSEVIKNIAKTVSDVSGLTFLMDLLKQTWKLLKFVLDREWGKACHVLGKILDLVIDRVAFVLLVLWVVGMCIPGVNVAVAGATAGILYGLTFLAGAKLALGTALATSGIKDEDGKKYTWGDVALDGVTFVLSAFGARAARFDLYEELKIPLKESNKLIAFLNKEVTSSKSVMHGVQTLVSEKLQKLLRSENLDSVKNFGEKTAIVVIALRNSLPRIYPIGVVTPSPITVR